MFWKKHTDSKVEHNNRKDSLFSGGKKKELKQQKKLKQNQELQKWNDFDELMEDLDQYN